MSSEADRIAAAEEARLAKALGGRGSASKKAPAEPKVTRVVPSALGGGGASAAQPRTVKDVNDADVPEWKRAQLAKEHEEAQRAADELARRAQKAVGATATTTAAAPAAGGGGGAAPAAAAAPATAGAGAVDADALLQKVVAGEVSADDPAVAAALGKTQDRLDEVFKAQHTPHKQAWARGVAADAKERMDQAYIDGEAEYAAKEAEAEAVEARRGAIVKQRAAKAAQERAAAREHYASVPPPSTPYLNALELGVSEQLGMFRAKPALYAAMLETRRGSSFQGLNLMFMDPDGLTTQMRTAEGKRAVTEAIGVLNAAESLPQLAPSAGLTRAMFDAVSRNADAPNALEGIQLYGKVRGSARQIMYRGPVGTAEDVLMGILTDDANKARSRQQGLLDAKFKHFGICAGTDESGKGQFCWLLLATEFEEKQ